jgi:mono/diheme cytochrome c family protein
MRPRAVASLLAAGAIALGCRNDMRDQPRSEPLESSRFFPDGLASRSPVPGTVARGQLGEDRHFETGMVDGKLATTFPRPVTAATLAHGRERFEIFCTPCHGQLGDGQGMVVRRGFKQPTSFHVDRLRAAPPGYFFDVMTNGFGTMASYASQVPAADRWAIAAYIRALQRSQHAKLEDLTPAERERLLAQPPGAAPDSAAFPAVGDSMRGADSLGAGHPAPGHPGPGFPPDAGNALGGSSHE